MMGVGRGTNCVRLLVQRVTLEVIKLEQREYRSVEECYLIVLLFNIFLEGIALPYCCIMLARAQYSDQRDHREARQGAHLLTGVTFLQRILPSAFVPRQC